MLRFWLVCHGHYVIFGLVLLVSVIVSILLLLRAEKLNVKVPLMLMACIVSAVSMTLLVRGPEKSYYMLSGVAVCMDDSGYGFYPDVSDGESHGFLFVPVIHKDDLRACRVTLLCEGKRRPSLYVRSYRDYKLGARYPVGDSNWYYYWKWYCTNPIVHDFVVNGYLSDSEIVAFRHELDANPKLSQFVDKIVW